MSNYKVHKNVKQFIQFVDSRNGQVMNRLSVGFKYNGSTLTKLVYWDIVQACNINDTEVYLQKALLGDIVFSVQWADKLITIKNSNNEKQLVWSADKASYAVSKIIEDYGSNNIRRLLFSNIGSKTDEYVHLWKLLKQQAPDVHAFINPVKPEDIPSILNLDRYKTETFYLKENIFTEITKGFYINSTEFSDVYSRLYNVIHASRFSDIVSLIGFTKTNTTDIDQCIVKPKDFAIISGIHSKHNFKENNIDHLKTIVITNDSNTDMVVNIDQSLGFTPGFLIIRELKWQDAKTDNGKNIGAKYIGTHARTQM